MMDSKFLFFLFSTLFFTRCATIVTNNDSVNLRQSNFFSLVQQYLAGGALSQWDLGSTVNRSTNTIHVHPPYCKFVGINCNEHGYVIAIDMSEWSLRGQFPPNICLYLPMLRYLHLGSNHLQGNFPHHLLNCSHLRHLDLSSNGLQGPLPDLSKLNSLRFLDMSDNFFNGEFPTSIFNLTNLRLINFNQNPGFHTWSLPDDILRLTKLRVVVLSTTELRGQLPEWIGNMTSLVDLQLCGNYHIGSIPQTIGKLIHLRHLDLYYNIIQGRIPDSIGNLTELVDLDFSVNKLVGRLPTTICKLPNLRVLQLYNNTLSGKIPPLISNSTTIQIISLYQNFLTGQIPPELAHSSNLLAIDLSENLFSGDLPLTLCNGGNLLYLLLLQNRFTGVIPNNFSNCKSLLRVRIGGNQLTGSIPVGLFALPHVSILDLSFNRLEGSIPSTIGNAKNLSALFMQGNLISGSLPPEIALANNLIKLDLSNNLLTGAIPEQIGQLTKLNLLSLQSNKLSSTIPHSLSLLKSLNVLNLSNNLLTGEIPECLCELLPNSMAFSNNHLSGPIPLPLLRDGLKESFTGNPDLCIASGNNNDDNNKSTYYIFPQCKSPSQVNHNNIWVVLSILSTLTFALITFIVLVMKGQQCCWYGARSRHKESHKPMSNSYNITSFHRAGFDKNEIVQSLTDRNIIREGGTGTVYKILLSNGYLVAVKKLASTKKLWYLERVLKSEVETLSNIRHKNIVKLYCFCSCSNSDSNFLVYEYIPNGNLWEALHGDARVFLDWPTRFKIALGIAQGLSYLHHHLLHPIVHRDIKSSNVLLDIDYQPKLSDFGIAKQLLNTTSNGDSTTLIVGTCGYLAPEYAYCSRPTTRCDVYSYAVVLMELLTGKKPLDPKFGENKDIVHWVSTKVRSNSSNSKDAAMEILDNRLSNGPCKNEMIHVVNIALRCSSSMPAFRPSMNQVVELLLEHPT